jgi:hypothetical protein
MCAPGEPPQLVGVPGAERGDPAAHRLVADGDPALGEDLLDVPEAEREAEVEPDRMGDHFGRERVAAVWIARPAGHVLQHGKMNAVQRAHMTSGLKPAKAIVAVVVTAAVCVACGNHPREPNVEPKVEPNGGLQITLSQDGVVVPVGDGSLLTAARRNARGPVQYLSRDEGVVTETATGAIRAERTGSAYVARSWSGARGTRTAASRRGSASAGPSPTWRRWAAGRTSRRC